LSVISRRKHVGGGESETPRKSSSSARAKRTFKLANTITFFPAMSSADMYGTRPLKIVLGPSGSPRSISSMYCVRDERHAYG